MTPERSLFMRRQLLRQRFQDRKITDTNNQMERGEKSWAISNRFARFSLKRTWRRGFVAICLSFFLFWSSLLLGERLAQPDFDASPETVDLYLPVEGRIVHTWAPTDDETPITVPLTEDGQAYVYEDPSKALGGYFVIDFEIDEIPRQPALYVATARNILGVKLNGELLYSNATNRSPSPRGGYEPAIYLLPRSVLKVGQNQIIIGNSGLYRKKMPRYLIAPGEQLMPAYEWGNALSIHLVGAATALLVLTIILYLAINWPQEERLKSRSLVLLMAAWAAYNLYSAYLPFHIENPWREIIGYALFYSLFLSFAQLALVWTEHLKNPVKWFAPLWAIIAVGLLITGIVVPDGEALTPIAWPVELTMKLLGAPVLIAILAFSHTDDESEKFWSTTALMVCLFAIFFEGLDETITRQVLFTDIPILHPIVPRYGLVMALGLVAAMAAEATRSKSITLEHNKILRNRLSKRESELKVMYDRQELLARETARKEERSRIMMDMHDGLGAQLVSLKVMIGDENPTDQALLKEVEECIRELRFVVDSVNTVGGSWNVVFSALQERIQRQFDNAGISLSWTISEAVGELVPSSENALHVSRFIAEACANIVRHSKADTAQVTFKETHNKLCLRISDNGIGLSDRNSGGRGLVFMKSRASRLGADLSFNSPKTGTEISLTFSMSPLSV